MRERELRLALICYGGVSLAVYMHGITKEIWRLARASHDFCDGAPANGGSAGLYRRILADSAGRGGIRLRVLTDIVAGASAGGINGIFLAHALETGRSLDPLTDLWLSKADADILLDPDARPLSRFTKFWAAPLLWLLLRRRNDAIARTVSPGTRDEVRRKLSNFIRARWFAPPFGGEGFSSLLLDAFDAMDAGDQGPPLLPDGHPLDLFVTVTDFAGHDEQLLLNSPAMVDETEHRLSIGFVARGPRPRPLADEAELVFAARATASFPGAFPPFTVRELDAVLRQRQRAWPGREAFLRRILPRHARAGRAEDTVLIDGSVLANAPFAQAIGALKNRPARREVDRRFVYIDPTPRIGGFRINRDGHGDEPAPRLPGFFRTLFGAVSDIPREQPIRDNLERIEQRSRRIRRMQHIIEALRPEVEATIEQTIGHTLFLDRPTPARLSAWRSRAQAKAAKVAGFAYPAYAHMKLSAVVEDGAALLFALGGDGTTMGHERVRKALWRHVRAQGIDNITLPRRRGVSSATVDFFRSYDLGFRMRRLRFLARRITALGEDETAQEPGVDALRETIFDLLGRYAERESPQFYGAGVCEAAAAAVTAPARALEVAGAAAGLKALDDLASDRLCAALLPLGAPLRRAMLLAYLGFPFYDIATLPLLQGEGLDEYDPIKVDRISPDDAQSIRAGDASATLKGIEFNSFGAFFSRTYRENDYLWGRLHGADRLVDIVLSALPPGGRPDAGQAAAYKRALFHAILDEEAPRLTHIADLIAELRVEIGGASAGGAIS
jgi:patatin-related protein